MELANTVKKVMQLLPLKNRFLALTLSAIAPWAAPFGSIASTSGLLAACSADQKQAETPNASTTNASDKQQMQGSGMNHSMAMDLGPRDANYDLRFIDGMKPHHQGAIEMANEAQQKSKRPEIKKLADEIIKAQNQEITQMKQWRTTWYPKAGDKPLAYDPQMGHMMEMSSDQKKGMMMNMDLGAADKDFDLRFINAMIPHHEGAVTMAQDALKKSQRPEIKKLAENIITSQNAEINQMKQWRKTWYNN